jgi:deazaflavin-dependent oxidoreductase (nitroreductase family)
MSDLTSSESEIIDEFRRNGGAVGGFYEEVPLLLLNTTGRKSGKQRTTPLAYARDGERLILIGSNPGTTKNPDWYYNLLAHPQITVEIGKETIPARATVLEGEVRERYVAAAHAAWTQARERWPQLPEMQAETLHRIPVIALTLLPADVERSPS